MNITIGTPVSGDEFFDREEIVHTLWETLDGHSVLLAAPRRVGKSSLILKLIDEPKEGFEVLWLDGQDYDTPEDLVADLAIKASKLRNDNTGILGRLLSKAMTEVEKLESLELWELKVKLREQLKGSWRVQGEAVIRETLRPGKKLLIAIDELPILLHKLVAGPGQDGEKLAQDLLDWLRHLRQAPDFFRQVRQLVGGSIGLPRIASMIGSSAKINDLRPVEVGPLERPKARELAGLLLKSRGVELDPPTMEAFLDQTATFFPIFIQIMASVVASEARRREEPLNPGQLRKCYEQRALGPEFRICFEDYYERLQSYYSPAEARVARMLLRELAVAKEPLRRSLLLGLYQKELEAPADPSGFDLLLTWLADDFYVEEIEGARVQFKSRWMQDWWRMYHGSRP
jgi:hypothetical protein